MHVYFHEPQNTSVKPEASPYDKSQKAQSALENRQMGPTFVISDY